MHPHMTVEKPTMMKKKKKGKKKKEKKKKEEEEGLTFRLQWQNLKHQHIFQISKAYNSQWAFQEILYTYVFNKIYLL